MAFPMSGVFELEISSTCGTVYAEGQRGFVQHQRLIGEFRSG
jgi:hypothetical protein